MSTDSKNPRQSVSRRAFFAGAAALAAIFGLPKAHGRRHVREPVAPEFAQGMIVASGCIEGEKPFIIVMLDRHVDKFHEGITIEWPDGLMRECVLATIPEMLFDSGHPLGGAKAFLVKRPGEEWTTEGVTCNYSNWVITGLCDLE